MGPENNSHKMYLIMAVRQIHIISGQCGVLPPSLLGGHGVVRRVRRMRWMRRQRRRRRLWCVLRRRAMRCRGSCEYIWTGEVLRAHGWSRPIFRLWMRNPVSLYVDNIVEKITKNYVYKTTQKLTSNYRNCSHWHLTRQHIFRVILI